MSRKHFFLMMLCCLVPVAALGAIFLFQIPLNTLLFFGLVLICPISHIIIMLYMDRNHDTTNEGIAPRLMTDSMKENSGFHR